MEFHSKHPLNNITHNNPYSMLEALIPFVDYPMKLPLALFIKYHELRLIVNAFQEEEKLSQYGLHSSSNDPLEILANVMGLSPELLKTIMSMMDNMNTSGNNSSDNMSTEANRVIQHYVSNNNPPTHDYSFDDNIQNIFTEYDMLQAAEYSENQGG